MDFSSLSILPKQKQKERSKKKVNMLCDLYLPQNYPNLAKKKERKIRIEAPKLDPPHYGIFHLWNL